jgi:hypothetical protein
VAARPREEPVYDVSDWIEEERRMGQFHARDVEFTKIKIGRQKLLEELKKNRDKHKTEFEVALKGYQKAFQARLEEMVVIVKEAIEKEQRVQFSTGPLSLDVPQDHTADYDAVIAMLEWHEGEFVKLSYHEVQCYLRDKWDWKDKHALAFANYSGPAGPQGATGELGPRGFEPMRRSQVIRRI